MDDTVTLEMIEECARVLEEQAIPQGEHFCTIPYTVAMSEPFNMTRSDIARIIWNDRALHRNTRGVVILRFEV